MKSILYFYPNGRDNNTIQNKICVDWSTILFFKNEAVIITRRGKYDANFWRVKTQLELYFYECPEFGTLVPGFASQSPLYLAL